MIFWISVFLISVIVLYWWINNPSPKIEDINGVQVLNITQKKGSYSYPTWSPNGKHIAVRLDGDLWVIEPDGSFKTELKDKTGVLGLPIIWSDLEMIYYVELDPYKDFDTDTEIHVIHLADKKDTMVLENMPSITGFSLNPGNPSQLVVGHREWMNEATHFNTYVYDLKTNTQSILLPKAYNPKWSPNGNLIAYEGSDGFYVYDLKTKEIHQIYQKDKDEMVERLSWSPDGQWIAYRQTSSNNSGIYIVPSDGSVSPEPIINTVKIGVSHLAWSPDGDKIVFTTINDPYNNKIYMMDVPEKYRPIK
jgi:Tol biopolymer transport system component